MCLSSIHFPASSASLIWLIAPDFLAFADCLKNFPYLYQPPQFILSLKFRILGLFNTWSSEINISALVNNVNNWKKKLTSSCLKMNVN